MMVQAWAEVGDLATARGAGAGFGTQTASVAKCRWRTTPRVSANNATTEEFTVPSTVSIAQEGQVWYNTTSTVLKGFGASVPGGAWASGGNLKYSQIWFRIGRNSNLLALTVWRRYQGCRG